MKKLLESALENQSTEDIFRFHIRCNACGNLYANRPIRFSKAGIEPPTTEKRILYRAVYEQEFTSARQSAIEQATEHFNHCPICKRIVCNQCFLICDDLDMCRDCAGKLKEIGTPVLSGVITAVP